MFPVAAWCVTLEPADTQSIDILSEDISSESPPLTTACHVGNDKLIIGCRSGAAYVWDWVSHSMLRSMAGQHMKPIILIAVVTTPVDGASSSGVALLGSEGFQPSIITLCQNGILQQWKAKAMDADATKQWSKVSVAPSSPLRTFRLEVSCIGFGVCRGLSPANAISAESSLLQAIALIQGPYGHGPRTGGWSGYPTWTGACCAAAC